MSKLPLTANLPSPDHAIDVTRAVCELQRVVVGLYSEVERTVMLPEVVPMARWLDMGEKDRAEARVVRVSGRVLWGVSGDEDENEG